MIGLLEIAPTLFLRDDVVGFRYFDQAGRQLIGVGVVDDVGAGVVWLLDTHGQAWLRKPEDIWLFPGVR